MEIVNDIYLSKYSVTILWMIKMKHYFRTGCHVLPGNLIT